MDIIRISATRRAGVKGTQGLLEPNEEVGGEREISVGDIVGIVVIALGRTMWCTRRRSRDITTQLKRMTE